MRAYRTYPQTVSFCYARWRMPRAQRTTTTVQLVDALNRARLVVTGRNVDFKELGQYGIDIHLQLMNFAAGRRNMR